jgi:hypothetical protein
MKSVITETKSPGELPFPKLMKASGGIVLMLERGRGVRIAPRNNGVVYYSTSWEPDDFTDFHGTVTLSNGD